MSRDSVFTIEGEDIGKLKRYVIDPRSKKVTHLVFENGTLTRTEYLVAIELVDHIDDSGVHLRELPVDSFIELQRFRDTDFVVSDERAMINGEYLTDSPASTYYYYPSTSFGGFSDPNVMPADTSPRVQSPAGYPSSDVPLRMTTPGSQPPVRGVEDDNISPYTVPLKEGAKVVSSDQKHVGSVEKVFIDPNSERATHLLVTKGLLTKEKKLVPVGWVERIEEEEVYLAIDEKTIDRLPEHKL